jgi:hypothetical protein
VRYVLAMSEEQLFPGVGEPISQVGSTGSFHPRRHGVDDRQNQQVKNRTPRRHGQPFNSATRKPESSQAHWSRLYRDKVVPGWCHNATNVASGVARGKSF